MEPAAPRPALVLPGAGSAWAATFTTITTMILSSFSLAMALYPGRRPRANRRLPLHRRIAKRMRRYFTPERSRWITAKLPVIFYVIPVYFFTFVACPFAAGWCLSSLVLLFMDVRVF